jgi:hypothetical protein
MGCWIKVLFPELSDTTHTANIVYSEVIAGLFNHLKNTAVATPQVIT